MKNLVRYETKPVDSLIKAKEIQDEYNRKAWIDREKGAVLVGMLGSHFAPLLAGLGSFQYLNMGQVGVWQVAADRDLAQKCFQTWEARGYARDMCGGTRINCGTMFLDQTPNGKYPRPDFFLQLTACDNAPKGIQIFYEHLGVPCFVIEYPVSPDDEIRPSHREYFASQLHDAIEWMEKLTGRKYQDDLMIKAVKNEFRTTSLWARVLKMNRAIPAPLNRQLMVSLSMPVFAVSYSDETVEYCRTLLDEIEYRVRNKIAALATERCRLLHEERPPYYPTNIYKLVESYGAVIVGGRFDLVQSTGGFVIRADGEWEVDRTPEEAGVAINTREDALRHLSDRYLRTRSLCSLLGFMTTSELIKLVEEWHADGVIMHLNRGCKKLSAGLLESKRALQQHAIPHVVYEASAHDARDFSEIQVMDQLESFLENLGLSRIEE